MPLSHKFCWKRFARSLTLPAVTIALAAITGCRGDGSTKPSLGAMSPMRWFARDATSDESESTESGLQSIPGDYSTPPVPPPSPVGRAVVPAPPPEADAFYGVRPTSQETHESQPRRWSQTLRGMFEPEPKLKPIPAEVEPISHESFGAYRRTSGTTSDPPVPPPLLLLRAEPTVKAPATIATHIEPLSPRHEPGQLPIIAARRFLMLPNVEPSPWPYRPIHRAQNIDEPQRIVAMQPADARPTFLPLPDDDADGGPALLP